MRKNEEEQGMRLVQSMTRVILGGLVGLVVCLLFFMLCSIAISLGLCKESIMYQLAVLGCVIGAFAGGLWAVKRCRSRTLIIGLAVGGVFFLLLLTIGVVVFQNTSPESGGLGLLCGALCGGAAAGILGGRPRKKRR